VSSVSAATCGVDRGGGASGVGGAASVPSAAVGPTQRPDAPVAAPEDPARSMRVMRGRGINASVICDMTRGELASSIAGYMVHYDPELTVEFVELRRCFCAAFKRNGIVGEALIGDGAVKYEEFLALMSTALVSDGVCQHSLGYSALIRKFAMQAQMQRR
jgi:hypothetical protein